MSFRGSNPATLSVAGCDRGMPMMKRIEEENRQRDSSLKPSVFSRNDINLIMVSLVFMQF